jgi:hypothetical protein
MYHWLFDNEWRNIGNELDYRALKLCFERQYERDLELGIAKRRKAADILWMTVFLPIVLLLDFALRIFSRRDAKKLKNIEDRITKTEREVAPERRWCRYLQRRPYRQKRRRVSGLLDSKYRTEIPAYTISLYLFVTQLLVIWCPTLFGLAQSPAGAG